MAGRGSWSRAKPAPVDPHTRVATDVETFAEEAYAEDDHPPPKSNTKEGEAAVAEWREEHKSKWERDRATSWLTARLACIAIVGPKREDIFTVTAPEYEVEVLQAAQEALAQQKLYTFNGNSFDLRFLIGRCLIHRLPIVKGLTTGWFRKWNTPEHFDVRWALMGGQFAKGTLKDIAKAFGLPGADEQTLDGSDVGRLVRTQDWDTLEAYCLQDTRWCRQLGIMAETAGLE
jgi:DNA polymerase elongation subunit (family B)